MTKRAIIAAALAAGLLVQTQGFTQVPINPSTTASTAAAAATTSDPEKAARETWRAVMKNIPVPGKGCFHVKYPNIAWESVECKEVKPHAHPLPVNRTIGTAPGAGYGADYVAQAQGLINAAFGKFFISGVTSEQNVNTPNTLNIPNINPKSLIVGSNEYSLQLNTNNLCSSTTPAEYCAEGYIHTAACGDYGNCHVWQQFMYATDYNCSEFVNGSWQWYPCGEGALFMQYWLYNWTPPIINPDGTTTSTCPKDGTWWQSGTTCYKNSGMPAGVPDIPVTDLGDVILIAGATIGGDDAIGLQYGDDYWMETAEDSSSNSRSAKSGIDIASVWNQAEFNVVGDMNLSEAQFNDGAEIIVLLAIEDGSQSAPNCPNNAGTTGEINNMTLGSTCVTGVGTEIILGPCGSACVGGPVTSPYIEFSESDPYVCVACGPVVPGPPPPIEE